MSHAKRKGPVLIGRLERTTPHGARPPAWHATYFGERLVYRHFWGQPASLQPSPVKVKGYLPRCGATMYTQRKGFDEDQVTQGEPTCQRCRKKLRL